MTRYIQLHRQFRPVLRSHEKEVEKDEILSVWGYTDLKTWNDLDKEFRCVILSEAGAGKTEEFQQHASELESQGKPAFFIRIEDIEDNFYNAFEIGEEDQFKTWLQSPGEAWFFLDSVDEARLENPRAFEKSIRRFSRAIAEGVHRAHIYISSRPYAWRPEEDRRLMDKVLFLPTTQEEENSEEDQRAKPQSALKIYFLNHLDKERIRRFFVARSAQDVDRLLREIERANLWNLAERPFDLEGILAKWEENNELGGRLELLRHSINKRLGDDHNVDREQRQPLNLEQARQGARRLAAAVILSGLPGLNVLDGTPVKPGIDAKTVLADWNPKDVDTLLERGIFNDVIFGAVRFRQRDVRELLAAEWFEKLLETGNSRHTILNLFFRDQYGEKIITPRLRPILPWLILFDDDIRRRSLEIHPEIAVEGGEPSRLPLSERRKILADIVKRIASNEDDHSTRDNTAIARIANLDLTEDVQQLISEFRNSDDAIFFLGRLVWQGELTKCLDPLVAIALDGKRGIYARIASARAIMTCGSPQQKQNFWQKLNDDDAQIPHKLLAELVSDAEPNSKSVEHFLISLGKLQPFSRYEFSGLDHSLLEFIERLFIASNQRTKAQLIDGLYDYLKRPPFVERRECYVSKEYAWLLNPTIHAIEKLLESRNSLALEKTALSIMLMAPALSILHDNNLFERKNNLHVLVPGWPELNDALYWECIEQARSSMAVYSKGPLTDDWSIAFREHFWKFNLDSLPRLLDYMRSRKLQDDRLVVLSTAFRIYMQADKPAHILQKLHEAVAEDSVLKQQFDILLNPPVSETTRRFTEEHAEYLRNQEKEKLQEKQYREKWITELRENPDRVRNPKNLKPGEFTSDQFWLMSELLDRNSTANRSVFSNWHGLIPDFGEDVAHAYRDAAVKHWRYYLPALRSEGAQSNNIPYSLIFAMAGLEIEATENPEFPSNLDEAQVNHALRYITWELNGFPSWFERMYKSFPDFVNKAVAKELLWELKNTGSNETMHYILEDIVYYAPWLYASVAPVILEWIEVNPTRINTNRHYCIRILANSGTEASKLAELATLQISQTKDPDIISWWYAILVDCDPINGIPNLGNWLSGLDKEVASRAAQIFITTMIGDKHGRESGSYFGYYREPEHLKLLYIMMHRYIRAEEDINRVGGGAYTPELRDDAQDARNRLFNLLAEMPGKASYSVIKQLVQEHPCPASLPVMAKLAYKRAEEDGDLEPWSAEQVSEFDKSQLMTPATHRQLFELTVHRLLDLKNWLERGNDSPWKTWQRANEETEMRNLIAGWLNQHCREQYTTAQEPELANSQRMDICLLNTNVCSPVPIELKLLDKGWSGPKLCERLRNQLAGDYLREESARCGVMLLVWQGRISSKHWKINGQNVGLCELASALKHYWQGIEVEFPGVDAIDVIVINLTERERVSDS